MRRRATDAARNALNLRRLPPEIAQLLRPRAATLAERVAHGIQAGVRAYGGNPCGRRHSLIEAAVAEAASYFLDLLENKPADGSRLFRMFQDMGCAEAAAGHDLDSFRAAHHVAAMKVRAELTTPLAHSWITPAVLTSLFESLLLFLDQLIEHAHAGYLRALGGSRIQAERRLLAQGLIRGLPSSEIARLSRLAQWEVPHKATVLVAELDDPERALRAVISADSRVLGAVTSRDLTLICPDGSVQSSLLEIARLSPYRVARSWQVPVDAISDAFRWASNARSLARHGNIADAAVIDCGQHRLELWIHADPTLTEGFLSDLLQPLFTEKRHQRVQLARTLLAWLRTHGSAPSIAESLGVHHQTVRSRVKRLRRMYGEAMDDPHISLALQLALEAELPRWERGR